MTMTHMSDLIPGLVARDEGAVANLLDRYWPRAYQVALHLTGDPGAAEDVAQETFVRVLQSASKLREPEAFRSWFFGILRNTANMHQRTEARRRVREERVAPPEAIGDSTVEEREQASLVREHLARLPAPTRFALTLRYLESMSLAEVSEALGCPMGTASSRIRRGLESLQRSLPALNLSAVAGLDALRSALEVPAPAAPTAIETIALAVSTPAAVAAPPSARALLTSTARTGSGRSLGLLVLGLLIALAGSVLLGLVVVSEDERPAHQATTDAALEGTDLARAPGDKGSLPIDSNRSTALADDPLEQPEPETDDRLAGGVVAPGPDAKLAAPADRVAAQSERVLLIQVSDEAGEPVSSAQVAWAADADDELPTFRGERFWDAQGSTRSDPVGRVTLRVPAGQSGRVVARKRLLLGQSAAVGSEASGPVDVRLIAPERPASGRATYVGRVVVGGQPVANTRLSGGYRFHANTKDTGNRRFVVQTGDDGRFALHNLRPGLYILYFELEGHVGVARNGFKHPLRAGEVSRDDLTFVKQGSTTVTGALVLPPELKDQRVYIMEPGLRLRAKVEGATWRLEGLPAGRRNVLAFADGYAPITIGFEVPEGVTRVEGPELRIGEGARVSGRILGSDGKPYPRVRVDIRSGKRQLVPARGYSDEDGRFCVLGLQPGSYHVALRVEQGTSRKWPTWKTLDLRVEGADVDLGDLQLDQARSSTRLTGVILGPTGEPVANARVALRRPRSEEHTMSDAQGRFVFDKVPGAKVALSALQDELVTERPLEVDLATYAGDVTLRLVQGGRITGRLEPAPEAGVHRLTAELVGSRARVQRDAKVDRSGAFRFSALPEGTYALEWQDDRSRRRLQVVQVRAGEEQQLTLSLASNAAKVQVRIDPLARARATDDSSLRWRQSRSNQGRVAAQEQVELTHLQPGRVTLTLLGRKGQLVWRYQRELQVPAGDAAVQVSLSCWVAPAQGAVLTGTVRGQRWLLEQQGLGTGNGFDVAIPGETFRLEGLPPGEYVLRQEGTETRRVLMLRAGETTTIDPGQ